MNDRDEVARVALILEKYHHHQHMPQEESDLLPPEWGLEGFSLVHSESFRGKDTKVVVVKDSNNNLYVHFYGTGDGNWIYNSASYGAGPQPSEMQEWACTYFDKIYKQHYAGKEMGKLYVSGHSQGDNNAKYVTLRSEYGDDISACIAIDGPGFSTTFVDQTKAHNGEDYFNRRREKIWGYYGEHDYVSPLGQEQIVLENQTKYLKFYDKKDANRFALYHMANGALNENNEITIVEGDSQFRQLIIRINDIVTGTLSDDKQSRIAELAMKLVEDLSGAQKSEPPLSKEEFEELKKLLVPVLAEALKNVPAEHVSEVLVELFGLDPKSAEAIKNLLENINSYSKEELELMLTAILDVVDYNPAKEQPFGFDTSQLPPAILALFLTIVDLIESNSDDLVTLLEALTSKAIEWIAANPWKFAGLCLAFAAIVLIYKVASGFATAVLLIKLIATVLDHIKDLPAAFKDAILKTIDLIAKVIQILKVFIRRLNPGWRYANRNPYIKVDSGKLRSYAERLRRVNQRLGHLDSDLRGLYWQVGWLDIYDILRVNLLTSQSPTLYRAQLFLTNTANRFESAEKKIISNLGE